MRRLTAAVLVPLFLLAVAAARETHAHSRGDNAGTVVHAHLVEAAHLDHAQTSSQISSHDDHGRASYLNSLQLTNTSKVLIPDGATQTAVSYSIGEPWVALVRSENSRAHAPPGQVIRSLRSPPA